MNQTLANKTISIFIRDASQLNHQSRFPNRLIDIASETHSSLREYESSPQNKKKDPKNFKVTLDYEEVKGGEKRMQLPSMIKPQPKTTMAKD